MVISFEIVSTDATSIYHGDGLKKPRLILKGLDSEVARIAALVLEKIPSVSDGIWYSKWAFVALLPDVRPVFVSIDSAAKRLGITRDVVCDEAGKAKFLELMAKESGYYCQQKLKAETALLPSTIRKITDFLLLGKQRFIEEAKAAEDGQIYIRPNINLPRSVQILSSGIMKIHPSKTHLVPVEGKERELDREIGQSADPCYGRGSSKKARAAFHFLDGFNEVIASSNINTARRMSLDVRREISFLERLHGKSGIIQMHDVTTVIGKNDARKLFLSLELCKMGELYEAIVRGIKDRSLRLSRGDVAGIVLDLLDAMKSLQEARILHRDIKPENVVLSKTDRIHARLLDFDFACDEDDEEERKRPCGSPDYVAPEYLAILKESLKAKKIAEDNHCDQDEVDKIEEQFGVKIAAITTFKREMWTLGATLYVLVREKIPLSALPLPAASLDQDPIAHLIYECMQPDPKDRPDPKDAHAKYTPLILRVIESENSKPLQ